MEGVQKMRFLSNPFTLLIAFLVLINLSFVIVFLNLISLGTLAHRWQRFKRGHKFRPSQY